MSEAEKLKWFAICIGTAIGILVTAVNMANSQDSKPKVEGTDLMVAFVFVAALASVFFGFIIYGIGVWFL